MVCGKSITDAPWNPSALVRPLSILPTWNSLQTSPVPFCMMCYGKSFMERKVVSIYVQLG